MNSDTDTFRRLPVPESAPLQAMKLGYRETVAIDHMGPLAEEACPEARDSGLRGHNFYNATHNPPYNLSVPGSVSELLLRRSVIDRLLNVDALLAPAGVALYLLDAWRPQAIQRFFYDIWFPDWLSARTPGLEGEALVAEVEKYWSAPTAGENSPSPHSTGAAVDLTLVSVETGHPLYMGGIFDDLTELAWTDWFERFEPQSMSDEEARGNRRLLYWAMTQAGFANNPTEWWHYSWGDQMWAKLTGAPKAHFGGCRPLGHAIP
jgi:D-alanyl-D-alanine dipeptidase